MFVAAQRRLNVFVIIIFMNAGPECSSITFPLVCYTYIEVRLQFVGSQET